jgi:hypothetical protein
MQPTRFIQYCLSGLQEMYIPSEHIFSACYRLVNGRMRNLRNREEEFKYTMNTLMGLHKARSAGYSLFLDVEENYHELAARVDERSSSPENIAATVWTGNCIGTKIPPRALELLRGLLEVMRRSSSLSAQALSWAILACATMKSGQRGRAAALVDIAREGYIHKQTFLVRHRPTGFRRDWASFAASCYMAYALLVLARETGDRQALEIGIQIVRALVSLQGPQGQWGWFYDVPRGRVVDYYPVYSVHQHSMAPFFLLEAIDQGFTEFRVPLISGFRWILECNELKQEMIENDYKIIWRSAIRKEPFAKLMRIVRANAGVHNGYKAPVLQEHSLEINRECRSYELGWALWAFSGRQDYNEIMNDPHFR